MEGFSKSLLEFLDKLKINEWYVFNPRFIFSAVFIALFVCVFQIINNGLNIDYVFKDYGQVHANMIIWLALLFSYFYIRHSDEKPFKRFVVAFYFLLFMWEVHEILWLGTALWKGNKLITPERAANFFFNFTLMTRNFTLLGCSILIIRKYINVSKRFLILLVFQVFYWLNINYTLIFYDMLVIRIVDTLPYLFVDKISMKKARVFA